MDIIKNYVDEFNRDDEEFIRNDIDNAHAYEWMKREVPVFECPDKDIERAYYFRFRTYRKHIKTTKDGIVGVPAENGELTVSPIVPDDWDYFRLTGVRAQGKEYDIIFDRNGEKYGLGKGLTVNRIM